MCKSVIQLYLCSWGEKCLERSSVHGSGIAGKADLYVYVQT